MKTTTDGCVSAMTVRAQKYSAGITFGIPGVVCFFHNLHHIWTPAPELAVPQQKTLWFYVAVNETAYCWPKCLFLIRA